MLAEKELTQIRTYIIRILPEVLRQEPEIATTIEGILAQHFPRRDEFARLLDELALTREEMREGFERVDARFEQVDSRFEQVDSRFEQVDGSILEVRRQLAKLNYGQEHLIKRMDGLEAWMKLLSGDLRREKGRALEDMLAAGLRYGLKNPDIAPEQIRLRQKLVDAEGRIFRVGYETEVDLIVSDSKLILFEVKATARSDDVEMFAWKVELVAAQNPDRSVEGVLMSLGAREDVPERCAQHGLTFLGE